MIQQNFIQSRHPAAAARHPKFGIPAGGFVHFYGSWVF